MNCPRPRRCRLLSLKFAIRVEISDASHLAGGIVLDLRDMAIRTNLHVAGRLALRDLRVERRPFRAPLAALEAEAGLVAGDAAVARNGVDRHASGVDLLVAKLFRAQLENLEIVAAWQARPVARTGDAHLVLGLGVIGLEIGEGDRPVEKIGARDVPVGGRLLELMLLEAKGRARPVGRRSADGFDDPGRQVGEVLVNPPTARGRPHIGPCKLGEAWPFVVDEIREVQALARFEHDDFDALLRQLVAKRSAARARPYDDDDAVVVLIEFRCHVRFLA